MPFVLKNSDTSELFSCSLINKYELPYFGLQVWEDEEQALEEREQFLHSRGIEHPQAWLLIELDEMKVKLGNVKLKNDPSNRLIIGNDDQIRVEKRD